MRVLRFNAIWCPGCLVMRPIWKKINEMYPTLSFEDIDYDMNQEEVSKWNIGDTLPVAIIVDDNNNEIKRIIGEKSKKELIKLVSDIMEEKDEKK